MDFRTGYGGGSVPGIGTSGRNENSIIGNPALTAGPPGYSVFTVPYTDEWMMDAYDVYVKINNGSPQFFSQGIWNTVPGPGTPLPPPGNNPGDANPHYPSNGTPGTGYTIKFTGAPQSPSDWVYTIPGGSGATIEATGWLGLGPPQRSEHRPPGQVSRVHRLPHLHVPQPRRQLRVGHGVHARRRPLR